MNHSVKNSLRPNDSGDQITACGNDTGDQCIAESLTSLISFKFSSRIFEKLKMAVRVL
jgi:hypothetical protein